MSVYVMDEDNDFSYPIFEWFFVQKDGSQIGSLRAWAFYGAFVFQDFQKKEAPQTFHSLEEVLVTIDVYGWGEPPHLDEVSRDLAKTKEKLGKFLKETPEVVQDIFDALWEKWEKLATTIPGSLPATQPPPVVDEETMAHLDRLLEGIDVDLSKPPK